MLTLRTLRTLLTLLICIPNYTTPPRLSKASQYTILPPDMERRRINFLDEGTGVADEGVEARRPRVLFCLALLLIIILGGCAARWFFEKEAPTDPNEYEAVTLEQKKPDGFLERIGHFVFSKDVLLQGERKDRVNILLLGMGGPGHDGPYLTDTIILASIEPSTNQIAMFSIPRDLAVKIQDEGIRKINNANAFGENKEPGSGAVFATTVIEDTFDTDVHYYIRADFTAFQEIIDEVGGITINVPRSFTDMQYPDGKNGVMTIYFQKGAERMTGARALQYARSRHGNNSEGSDFARASRQQQMLVALKEKVLSFETLSNPVRIHHIITSLNTHITTNLSFPDIIALIKRAKRLNTRDMTTVVFDTNNYLTAATGADGAFLLVPSSGTFKEMEEQIKNIFDEPKTDLSTSPVRGQGEVSTKHDILSNQELNVTQVSSINIEIQNGTWRAGLAAQAKKILEDANLPVTRVGNTPARPVSTSGIYAIIQNAVSIEQLTTIKEILNIPMQQTIPSDIIAATSTEVLVILGEDYQK